ncbi:MAG: DNA translocase FtsK, partial [Bilophila sp.]
DLLQKPQQSDSLPTREVLENQSAGLMTCLSEFNILGELVRVTPGPVITLFEIRPAPGVRVGRFTNLTDDLARSLKAEAIRIQAPVPGCDTVGVEIPNEHRSTVNFRELIQSDAFQGTPSLLTMALGKDIEGRPAVRDLATMPHVLVAGTTGSGKSVCLNSILVSFLYKASPDDVKLMLVDPKRVEMAMYADLPHLVHPVVTEPSLATTALSWAVHEMDRRYDCLARFGVKNIKDFNAKLEAVGDNRSPELCDLQRLPYLVIVIDELADLMLTAGKDVESSIVRLAQLARAAGIHLIVATQRPSVDVVTGLIKANFPCRISFQVANKYDSRTILDAVGAEQLLGKGDMLFKPTGGKLLRLHGPFVTDDEVQSVVDYWKRQRAPQYDVDFSAWGAASAESAKSSASTSSGSGATDEESLYAEAVTFVQEQGRMSISLLQRRFRIGFNKAARFVERMEQDGILPPAERANKARQVRMD